MTSVAIDFSRDVEGVGRETILAGLTLEERNRRTIEKSDGFELVESANSASIVLDWATVYGRNSFDAQHRIEKLADIKDVERALWDGCRKSVDGIISRHHNRHISLFFSKRLARFPISPNYISIVTFALGIASGVLAGLGEYWSFFLAGLCFHAASVFDGVDGELARVKLEFSVTGEWLDTISDDTSDLLYYGGLGVGAMVGGYSVGFLSPTIFLMLGITAVVGKLASMVLYYRALIAKGRGDLYAFDWSFDDESADGLGAKVARALRYVTKNDFIAFGAFVLAAIGYAPLLVVAAAPGTWVVVISVFGQLRSN